MSRDNESTFLKVYGADQFVFCAEDIIPKVKKLMELGHVRVSVKGEMNQYMSFVDITYKYTFSDEFMRILKGLETENIFDAKTMFTMVLSNTFLYEDLPASLRLWIELQEEAD